MNTCPSVKNAHRGTERRRSQRPGARTSSPQHSACTHASASHFSISTSTAPFCLPHTAWMTSSSGRATCGGLKPALQGSRCFRRSIAAAHAFNRAAFMNTCHSVRNAHLGFRLSLPSPNGAADFSPGSAEPQRGDPRLGPKFREANPALSLHAARTSSVSTSLRCDERSP
jgi:hypothetical protein